MVKRCSYGTCKSDTRYPDRLLNGVQFVPFPKPNYDKCVRWIKLCGRPHDQLNPGRINDNRYICTKHFTNQSWPTKDFPDPVPADPYTPNQKPSRPSPKRRRLIFKTPLKEITASECEPNVSMEEFKENCTDSLSAASQTTNTWTDPMELMVLAAENSRLKQDLAKVSLDLVDSNRQVKTPISDTVTDTGKRREADPQPPFCLSDIIDEKNLIRYYTGFSKESFLAIFELLVPDDQNCPFEYTSKGHEKQVSKLNLKDQLLLTMCKLRINFDLLDLGHRFKITKQAASVIFTTWINYMFLRFGEIPIWPHRDIISREMPEEYRREFTTTFAILDCTEIKIEKPSSLKVQSQTYSDYKSTNTLKSLVAVDPRGSVIFSSMLFSGSISDKELFVRSGLQDHLKQLVEIDYLSQGDALMGDNGFNIEEAVKASGLLLNIPPFASSATQMSEADVSRTRKIAKHRVHVERAIRRIKTFKIMGGKFPVSLMASVNQIWYVCSFLTNFIPLCIKK